MLQHATPIFFYSFHDSWDKVLNINVFLNQDNVNQLVLIEIGDERPGSHLLTSRKEQVKAAKVGTNAEEFVWVRCCTIQ